ncbi:MAG: cupin domain-containing protein [Proteobacteria bacterium]|nr:cupin domain-containing protein [Pseudomonadota bacterium]
MFRHRYRQRLLADALDRAGRCHDSAHVHARYEETFYILSGSLEFILGEDAEIVSAGDFVRAPAGARHGFRNLSATEPVEMLVTFTPGGMEELFYRFRTGGDLEFEDFDALVSAYREEARRDHFTEYETG